MFISASVPVLRVVLIYFSISFLSSVSEITSAIFILYSKFCKYPFSSIKPFDFGAIFANKLFINESVNTISNEFLERYSASLSESTALVAELYGVLRVAPTLGRLSPRILPSR